MQPAYPEPMPRPDPRRAHAPSRTGRRYPDMRGWVPDPPDVRSTHGERPDEVEPCPKCRPWTSL